MDLETITEDAIWVADLLRDALKGDKQAREDLAVDIARRAHVQGRWLAPQIGLNLKPADYADFVQSLLHDLFDNNMRKLRKIRNPRALPAWLKLVINRRLIDKFRSKTERNGRNTISLETPLNREGEGNATLGELIHSPEKNPAEQAVVNSMRERLREARAELLNPEDDFILELYSQGYRPREIALIVDNTPNAVSIRLCRIKALLLKRLSKDPSEE
ncbi:MAG: sigma-70 family RNA polymerase sigma factor [Verrucomicrobia bacterium]|nr:sigma-70 family RNA polymerase sigma factor [Verrucomicrobiota bacterium]MCH8510940.1 sigma-70 family RNA polymerase sigma factor [Kiritimatiellia bacterium]